MGGRERGDEAALSRTRDARGSRVRTGAHLGACRKTRNGLPRLFPIHSMYRLHDSSGAQFVTNRHGALCATAPSSAAPPQTRQTQNPQSRRASALA